jgi:osmotically-inducible protein OsmY
MNPMNKQLIVVACLVGACVGCATQPAAEQPAAETKPAMRVMGESITPEEAISDEAIGSEVRRRLDTANPAAMAGVIVEVNSGIVTLRGAAPDTLTAWRAVAAARSVKGVKEVYNQIIVGGVVR